MTIYELYDTNIKSLPITDRLRLARLILNDAAPDDPILAAESEERYAQLVDDAHASGDATPLTSQDFDTIKQAIRKRSAMRSGILHA